VFLVGGLEHRSIPDLNVLVIKMSTDEQGHQLAPLLVESRVLEYKNIDVLHFDVSYENEKFVPVESVNIQGSHSQMGLKRRKGLQGIERVLLQVSKAAREV
jgi:hypothetical protein